jgi:GNAT superfamily N-acetyltransferase
MAISIRLLQEHEKELANNFFNEVYQINRPLKNFEWEFLNGPFGKAIYIVAVDESVSNTKIVGIQCAIPIELISSKGKTILTAKSEDTLVDPSYRGQKIFERMYDTLFMECRRAKIKYIWGFTPAQKAFERIGFTIPFKTEQALLVFNIFRAYTYLKGLNAHNKLSDKIKILGLCILSWLKGLRRITISPSEMKEVPLHARNMLFQNFYKNIDYFTLNETEEYMQWRLLQNPFSNNYDSLQTIQNEKIVFDGLINVRQNVSYIEQIMAEPGTEIRNSLVALIDRVRTQNTPLIRAFCFITNDLLRSQGKALVDTGFTYLKRGNYFVWKSLDDEESIKPEQLFINRLFTQGNL